MEYMYLPMTHWRASGVAPKNYCNEQLSLTAFRILNSDKHQVRKSFRQSTAPNHPPRHIQTPIYTIISSERATPDP